MTSNKNVGTKLELNRGLPAPSSRQKPAAFRAEDFAALAELIQEAVQAQSGLGLPPPKRQDVEPYRTCPHCSHTGPIQADFGWHHRDGKIYPCSWCRKCRRYPDLAKSAAKKLPHD